MMMILVLMLMTMLMLMMDNDIQVSFSAAFLREPLKRWPSRLNINLKASCKDPKHRASDVYGWIAGCEEAEAKNRR